MRSDLGPRSSPQLWRRRATIEVPERCAPVMQATVRFFSVFFTIGRLEKKGLKTSLSTRTNQRLGPQCRVSLRPANHFRRNRR